MGIIDLQCCNLCQELSFFHPNFNQSWSQMLGCRIYQTLDELKVSWDDKCEPIYKKHCQESHHSVIKYQWHKIQYLV